MSKKALRKDFYMEIRRSLGRFLSIFFIVAIGVAFFSGIRSAEPDMRLSGDAYFDEKNLMDIKVVSTLGLTKDDVKALEDVDGIGKVEPGYSVDALCSVRDSKKVVHIMSLLPTMNEVTVEEGRLPKKADECLVDVDFIASSEYKIGDKITFTSGTEDDIKDTLKTDTYTIVGTASSPCYISFHRGSSTIGTGTVSGFISVPDNSFDMDVYTEIYASVDGAKKLTAFTAAYDDRIEEVSDNVETIKKFREEARYQEIVDEANEKLDDAKKELNDAKKEADEKLGDAKAKLDDGRTKLGDARAEVADGYARLEDSRNQLNDKQAEVDQGYDDLNAQIDTLNGKIDELNQAKEQYNALSASGMTDPQTLGTLQVLGAKITEGEQQIEAARAQVEAARAQLDSGQLEINNGWAQVEQGLSDLDSAQSEIASKEQELNDAQKEYDDAKEDADKKIADGEKKIQDAEYDISKIEHAKWYIYDRNALTEYTGYGENADRMKAIGEVFPVLFFLVAALISLTTMTRMVEEQRTLIGTLKALGYERHSIAGKYLGYALLATVSGSIVGVLIGEKILPYIIITAYGIMYQHIHTVEIPYNLFYGLAASLAALACTLLATIFSCFREMREQAAELMRPPAPKQGKRVFMERIPFIWRRLSFIWKATVRNLVRYKKRFFMTVFGIGGCMALLLVGFGLKDSIFDIAVFQYNDIQLYDGNVILDEDASTQQKQEAYDRLSEDKRVENTAENLLQQVEVGHGKTKKDVYLDVPKDVKGFYDFVVFKNRVTGKTYKLDDKGAILTEKMAKTLDVQAGDSITIKDDEKGEIKVRIESICENYMGHYLYMTPGLYEELFGRSPDYNSIYYKMKDGKIDDVERVGEYVLETKGALSVSYTNTLEEQLDDMLGSLNIVLVVLVISAGMLAFVVLYNLNNINITERQRELATLKVLGFYDNEVSAYVYRENIILTVIGALFGMVLGRILHQFVIVTVEIDSVMFGRNIDLSSFIYSFLITLGFSFFVNGVMYFKLKRINMVESLKSVE
ncbi:FtsX-like permease family protein [Faecalicatena sp. AGMB00832]|uniref:FtsX-like permease family protein n=1 Tax=Faecalicatena faecalis TaxID=2726362 RepID=A0ABS6D1W5_9FIRM|nr:MULTISPECIES: FtsX-like permease family protein [Faecalicatena]MBU3875187.1 FtsX-like permease family protein [Faecalicatena faecalis]MCI6467816.1 FtsX-like permease family protein [Faecalicatena sp.]MDY5619542.1 FtsX-like permease family protein [Lachnospiraceae bacterium]